MKLALGHRLLVGLEFGTPRPGRIHVVTLSETVFAHHILWSYSTEAALLIFPMCLRHLDLHLFVHIGFSLCSLLVHSVFTFCGVLPKSETNRVQAT
jgi:hypothetical protein